jgi:hypothetical protein
MAVHGDIWGSNHFRPVAVVAGGAVSGDKARWEAVSDRLVSTPFTVSLVLPAGRMGNAHSAFFSDSRFSGAPPPVY